MTERMDGMNLQPHRVEIDESLHRVEKWVEDRHYRGYEPFDGLSSPLRRLTFGNLLMDRLLLQLVRQSPVNLRPLFGIRPLDSTIGRGYMAWGYCWMFRLTGRDEYRRKAFSCLDWLMDNKSPGYPEYTWGKHFDFASRGGLYRTLEPILIWTALIGQAFLESYELWNEGRHLEVADSLCGWILTLPKTRAETGFCLGYHHHDDGGMIHNSNMVGAAVLARTAKHTGNVGYLEVAREAMRFSCAKQQPDGSWLYGEEPMHHWIDNFHTGYNLDGLKCYIECSGDGQYEGVLRKGIAYYKRTFFEESGRPKYYHSRAYPIDSQCAAQGIDTLANFGDTDEEALCLAQKVALWTIRNMQDRQGFFHYRQYPGGIKAKTPMLHWAQANTYKALAVLLARMNDNKRVLPCPESQA